jgi:hypothetical protein
MANDIRFYTDEHVAHAVAKGRRRRGVDVLTAADASMLGADDQDHLALAVSQGRVVFTQDDDFLRLHAAGTQHCGIVYVPHQTRIGTIVTGLILVFQVLSAAEMINRVEFL